MSAVLQIQAMFDLKHVRLTIFAVEKRKVLYFWVCVCSPRFQACRAHTPYYSYIVTCSLSGRTIFFNMIS